MIPVSCAKYGFSSSQTKQLQSYSIVPRFGYINVISAGSLVAQYYGISTERLM